MEQHPVPQNVTTFQFRLVGDMTIKQFGYLAGGVILGYICYKLPLPFFFTWPLGLTSLLLGIGLAFVPVGERPMDIWISSFLKNTYNPTQYVWQKTGASLSPAAQPVAESPTKKSFFSSLFPRPKAPANSPNRPIAPSTPPPTGQPEQKPPADLVGRFFKPQPHDQSTLVIPQKPQATGSSAGVYPTVFMRTPPSVTGKHLDTTSVSQQPTTTPSTNPQSANIEAQKRIENLEKMLASVQKELESRMTSDKRIGEMQLQLADALTQKQKTENELVSLRQQFGRLRPPAPFITRPAGMVPTAHPTGPTVRVIAPEGAVRAGLPRLTTFPNVITGIIKDFNGNLLPNVLVTVRDKDDIPLRALKTNKLGQFAASTPLPNGTYLIEVEDPRGMTTFDRAQVTLTGVLLPPIEVAAKTQKQINRDNLAKQIFGDQQ